MPTDELHTLATLDAGPVLFYTASGHSVPLEGFYGGRSCFLTLSGPSLADANHDLLRAPGVVTLGVNNSWATFRPRLWTCADPPSRFCWEGWMDPSVTKLLPMTLANTKLRRKLPDGRFETPGIAAKHAPAVFLFQRNCTFEPADFLVQSSVNWGQLEKVECGVGIKGGRSVMIQALRLAISLGFRTINLVGADFRMHEERPYAFAEAKDRRGARSNNRAYQILEQRFAALRPNLEMHGIHVWNTTPGSHLKAFPSRRLSDAVAEAGEGCGKMDSAGWYGTPEAKPVSSIQVPACSTPHSPTPPNSTSCATPSERSQPERASLRSESGRVEPPSSPPPSPA